VPDLEEQERKHYAFLRQFSVSQVLYWAAQGLRGINVVLARPIVSPIASSLQRASAIVLWVPGLELNVVFLGLLYQFESLSCV